MRLMHLAAGKPVYALAISPAKSVRLRPVMERLAGLYLNKRKLAQSSEKLKTTSLAHLYWQKACAHSDFKGPF